jgi:hypothetical protein
MPQIEINPANLGTLVNATPVVPVPWRVRRRFEFVPNFRECRPGDVILFPDVTPNVFSRVISNAQLNLHSELDARWTHTAVYLYDDQVVEAVPLPGVRTRSLYEDIPDRILRVRRRQGLDVEQRYKIALRALSMMHSRYSFGAAFSIGWRSLGISNRLGAPTFGPVIICSKVFYDAYLEIARTLLQGCSIDALITPAHLSATADLVDVQVPWLRHSP